MPKQKQLTEKEIQEWRERGKTSLFFLARAILGFTDFHEDIHLPICRDLQNHENRKLIIVLPRDWFKSTLGSIALVIFEVLNNPNIRILIVQNSHGNACKKLQAIKQIFEKNKLFRALYPEILPTGGDRWSNECLTVNRTAAHPEGTIEAAGTGTAVISRHYDLIIEDDTVAPEKDALKGIIQQPTQMEIEKAIGWHRVAIPLQIHPTKSRRIVIGTRWAERDLIGYILSNEPSYKLITRSARENGVAVWDRFNEEALKEIEQGLGVYMFSTLYLNMPISNINQVFQRDWIQYYDALEKDELRKMVYCTSVDPAPSDSAGTSDPDYNIVLTTGVHTKTGHVYVMKYSRARMNPGELINCIISHNDLYKPLVTKIESIAYQRTLNYWLKRVSQNLNKRFYMEEIRSHGRQSKVDRIRALQPYFQAGLIHIRTHMGELERELLSFPTGAHDDILDALCMQISFWERETKLIREEIEDNIDEDIFSGGAIIDSLLGRVIKKNSYPYDMGIMKDRTDCKQVREYQYD